MEFRLSTFYVKDSLVYPGTITDLEMNIHRNFYYLQIVFSQFLCQECSENDENIILEGDHFHLFQIVPKKVPHSDNLWKLIQQLR